MKAHVAAGLLLSAFTVASCGGRQPVEINPDAQPAGTSWNGALSTPTALAGVADIRGQAWMGADQKDPNQTRAHVTISNAVPGGVHPWHVHRGKCGSDQGVLGPADAYKPLKVESNGRASSTAVLPMPLPKTGDFFVDVHASAKNMATSLACGNLAPPAR